jgi:hypothetical protein
MVGGRRRELGGDGTSGARDVSTGGVARSAPELGLGSNAAQTNADLTLIERSGDATARCGTAVGGQHGP